MGILKTIIKIFSLITIFSLIILTIISLIVFQDMRTLSKQKESDITFILKENNQIISITTTDKKTESITHTTENRIKTLNSNQDPINTYLTDSRQKKPTIILDLNILYSTKEAPTNLSPSLNTEDLIKDIKDPQTPKETKEALSLIIIPLIFNTDSKTTIKQTIKNYKQGNIQIYPKLKTFYLLSLIPDPIIEKALSKAPIQKLTE